MRRVLLFAVGLSLLGLSSAFAASFTVQAEDIHSFSTPVSISVPSTSLVALYLGGEDNVLPGELATAANATVDTSVNSKAIDPGTLSVQAQTNTARYHSWQTVPAPAGGLVLNGPAMLKLFQNGSVGTVKAGLFDCATASTATTACTQFAGDSSSLGGESASTETPVDFGSVTYTISAGRVLRLQIVNPSAHAWNVQWGYKSNRQSRLELTLATP
ncbi:MAG TPA: hypothetical protein VFV32_12735 [Acidimicrobiales bacterium]|nr:hypothetical protein [Acidimicrobiales bacterium]